MYMDNAFEIVKEFDPEIAELTMKEEKRQEETLCLIASENYASPVTLALEGTIWADKNAEGLPGKRYVGGVKLADELETLAQERAKKLFGAEHVCMQAYSSTLGNIAVLRALLEPGDTILSMELDQGGHLSHGAGFHYSGKTYNAVFYGLNKETETIDMDEVEKLAKEHHPKLIICGASSYPRAIDYKRFAEIAHENGAYMMADIAHPVGLIAAGLIPSPFPWADVVSTSTHKTFRGPRGCGVLMCKAELAKKIDNRIFPGMQGAAKLDMIASRAVLFKEAMTDTYKAYQTQVLKNAKVLAEELQKEGLRLVTGGTDTHLILVDVRNLIPTGKEAEEVLESVGIVTNKNQIPYDPQKPNLSSGLRIGSPALTTRGFKEDDFREVARLVAKTLKNYKNEEVLEEVRKEVAAKVKGYPLFSDEWYPKN